MLYKRKKKSSFILSALEGALIGATCIIPGASGGVVALLKWSPLNISSSEIRLRRQNGADIHFLVPDAALRIMDAAENLL